jgi:hypothetical protein
MTDPGNSFARRAAARRMQRIGTRIERALHGLPPDESGGILAGLLAKWLAGHFIDTELHQRERPETNALRDVLLRAHMFAAREMVADAERELLSRTANIVAARPMNEPFN